MKRVNNLGLVPCIVLSIIVHSLVFFAIFYKNNKQNLFVQVPFDVSFYSPVQVQPTKVIEEKKEEVKPVEKVVPKKEPVVEKKKKVAKSDIVVNDKKKKKEKKEEVKKQEEPKQESVEEKVAEEKQQAPESSEAIVSSNKGIMLENKNFKYSYYTNTIVKKISKYWQWSNVTSAYRTIVYFKILKDGSVSDIRVTESSLDQDFDQNAIRAIQLASPFAPLPSTYEENYLGVYFEFKFH